MLDIELSVGIHSIEKALQQFGDGAGLEAIRGVPVEGSAGGPLNGFDEPLVMRRDAQASRAIPLNDCSSNRQCVEQGEIVHRRVVWSRIQSVRPTEPLSSHRPGPCSLHSSLTGRKVLIPSIFFSLADMLTAVRKPRP